MFIPASLQSSIPFSLLVDFHARQHPDAEYAKLVPFTALDGNLTSLETRKVSWADFHGAIMRAAHIISPLTPNVVPARTRRVIALLVATDNLIYQTLSLAIIRSGNIVRTRMIHCLELIFIY